MPMRCRAIRRLYGLLSTTSALSLSMRCRACAGEAAAFEATEVRGGCGVLCGKSQDMPQPCQEAGPHLGAAAAARLRHGRDLAAEARQLLLQLQGGSEGSDHNAVRSARALQAGEGLQAAATSRPHLRCVRSQLFGWECGHASYRCGRWGGGEGLRRGEVGSVGLELQARPAPTAGPAEHGRPSHSWSDRFRASGGVPSAGMV